MTFEIEKHDYSEVYSQFQNVISNYMASAKNGHLNLQESNFYNRDIGNVKVLSVKHDDVEYFKLDYIQDKTNGDMLIVVGDVGNSRIHSLNELVKEFNSAVVERISGLPALDLETQKTIINDENVYLATTRTSRR